MNAFQAALKRQNQKCPPVWMMRQAGRYHSHYQRLRQKHTFVDLCKVPELACETTMGPIRDFDFDAAILFSDLLFPLEAMGMGLRYEVGPQLDWHLKDIEDLKRLHSGKSLASQLEFQSEAIVQIRRSLPKEKGLLGFVGGPLTLYCYAVEGKHQGNLDSARVGLRDGRFSGFLDKLEDLLVENMALQAQAGIDALAVLDTCAGEFDPETYRTFVVPALQRVMDRFKEKCPECPLVYYSKGTNSAHWASLKCLPILGKGIDWNHHLTDVLSEWGSTWAIQGNIDPKWLLLSPVELEERLRTVFQSVKNSKSSLAGWICGLGHGVLQHTPEDNVRLFVKIQREMFSGEKQ